MTFPATTKNGITYFEILDMDMDFKIPITKNKMSEMPHKHILIIKNE